LGREPLLFGHRGVPREAPENTIAGFRRALELGLDGVELDARLCGTGEVVVFHDDEVDRLTNGSGPIRTLSFAEIGRLDAGSKFGEKFRNEKIPPLDEVLALLGEKMLVNIELKSDSIRNEGLEAKVVELVQKMNLRSSVILSSFNPLSVWRVKRLDKSLVTALLFADDQPLHLRKGWGAPLVRADGIHPRHPLVTDKLVRKARSRNWFVGTWTVDSAAQAARLFRAGVDVVISNRAPRLREALQREMQHS